MTFPFQNRKNLETKELRQKHGKSLYIHDHYINIILTITTITLLPLLEIILLLHHQH